MSRVWGKNIWVPNGRRAHDPPYTGHGGTLKPLSYWETRGELQVIRSSLIVTPTTSKSFPLASKGLVSVVGFPAEISTEFLALSRVQLKYWAQSCYKKAITQCVHNFFVLFVVRSKDLLNFNSFVSSSTWKPRERTSNICRLWFLALVKRGPTLDTTSDLKIPMCVMILRKGT